ncbi:MAG: sensor histidine kinase [Eubacteriales bacterium]|nr:sensor histidine kinase [Eubacteriales bacterium]
MKRFLTSVYRSFMNLRISYKLILGYLVIILVPTFILEYAVYNQNYRAVLEQYKQNEMIALEIAKRNLNIQLGKIQESADFLRSNSSLSSYLQGFYDTEADELYYYLKDIQPLLTYLQKADDSITNITFYSTRSFYLHWSNHLITTETFPHADDPERSLSDFLNGFWYKESGNQETITYYQYLYDTNYASAISCIQIDVSLASLMENFSSLSGTVHVSFGEDTYRLDFPNHSLMPFSDSVETLDAACQTHVEELNLDVFQTLELPSSLYQGRNTLLILLVLLFCVLTAGYYTVTTSISRRIQKLEKHISQARPDNLVPMPDGEYQDEIGRLTDSYNQMIQRINDLLFQIYHTELEKKDAEFYALQAQIEPHFLYNILENIHMSAEKANDQQTAAMVISLGKFMRYNLNSNTGFVHLTDELLHAKNYLDIHKIRMQENLKVEISVFTDIDDILCPRFILQPLLENALKYAVVSNRPLTIAVTVKDRYEGIPDHDVTLEIRDDGEGISPEELEALRVSLQNTAYIRDAHIGLNSINNRLQAYYGSDCALQIESTLHQGTCIIMHLKRTGGSVHEDTGCGR